MSPALGTVLITQGRGEISSGAVHTQIIEEQYREISLENFVKHVQRNKDSRKILMMLV